MKFFHLSLFFTFLLFSCVASIQDSELIEAVICDSAVPTYFNPANSTFIPPDKSYFLDDLYIPLQLEGELVFYDLTASKICLLEQYLGQVADSIISEQCDPEQNEYLLKDYYYQYFGISINQQEHIYVNAFHQDELDSAEWKREPFIGRCYNGFNQWGILFNLETLTFSQYRSHPSSIHNLAEFPYERIRYNRCITNPNLKTFSLKKTDICSLENNYYKLEELASVGCYLPGHFINFDWEYLHQHIGAMEGNDRWIYLNSRIKFDDAGDKQFLEYPIPTIDDAGLSYWGVLFNLKTQEFSDLQFNFPR